MEAQPAWKFTQHLRTRSFDRALVLVLALLSTTTLGQSGGPPESLDVLLAFESPAEDLAERWHGIKQGVARLDEEIAHDGRRSIRIERGASSQGGFTALAMQLPIGFRGSKIELRGWLRTQDVNGFAGLWLRTNAGQRMLNLDNMGARNLNGTNDWAEFSVTVPLVPEADNMIFGALLNGTGKLWADTLQVLVDGQPASRIAAASKAPGLTAAADDLGARGSGVRVDELSTQQIDGLHLLGRVWGFLKYHHPSATSGKVPWDAELLKLLPRVLDARDTAEVESRMVDWIDSLGPAPPCDPCVQSSADVQQAPRLEWLDDPKFAGDALRKRLRTILTNRTPHQQFYVSVQPSAGNPVFKNESDYARLTFPDAGFQVLALFRFWSAVEYWFPYRSLIEKDWTQTLREFIPRLALAQTRNDYQLQLLALITRLADSHANLWSSLAVRPPVGACQFPVNVRFIEGVPAVASYLGDPGVFQMGDVLERLDGVAIAEQIERWRPYYSGSNDGSRLRDIAHSMTRGACEPTSVTVKRDGRELTLQAERVPASTLNLRASHSNELEGASFRMLSPSVAYLKISTAKVDEISANIIAARATEAIVVDLRGYPSEFVLFKLTGHFVTKDTAFARFTVPDLSNPGAFHWVDPIALRPEQPHYTGKLLVLVDETTQSQAEYTAMALRAAPRSTLIGSPTAGADGNVSRLPLPGGLWSLFSGIGVYYPDKRPTQQIGIKPDIPARATVKGIRRSHDEVLAAALRQVIRGKDAEKQIAALSKRTSAGTSTRSAQ